MVGAEIHQPGHHGLELGQGHLALEGAAEGAGDAGIDGLAAAVGHFRGGLELDDGLGDGHVDVGEVVALAGREHGVDVVHARVYRDLNDNGVRDPAEPLEKGVLVD